MSAHISFLVFKNIFFMPFKCLFYRFSDDYRGGGWPDCLKKCGRGGITDVNYIVCSGFVRVCVCVCTRVCECVGVST